MNLKDFFTDMSSLFTLLSFLTFLGIVAWAYSGARKDAFNEAANLPFADEPAEPSQSGNPGVRHG